ncbi:MAG: hypothetical protein ACXVCP_15475 [Bdellovibrio sp.]
MKNLKTPSIIVWFFILNLLTLQIGVGRAQASIRSPLSQPPEIALSNDENLDQEDFFSDSEMLFPSDVSYLAREVHAYRLRFNLKNVFDKLVDNSGRGQANLYGTRNFRVVLPGVLYRGGANNIYLSHPRSNVNPLPRVGLDNLCRDNFSNAVYLYMDHNSLAPHSITCKNSAYQTRTLLYQHYSPVTQNEKILDLIYKRIKGNIRGPIYIHCWNGWHYSGLMSAIALKQFCGWSDKQADAYWVKNTDGQSSGHRTLRAVLRNFKPYKKFAITQEEKNIICPVTN